MKKQYSKEDKITLFIILSITILLGNAFLRFHFSSDTYILLDLGYMNYPQNYFLPEGRIISSMICYIAGFLHIPYNIYIISMTSLAIVFLSLAIFKFYKKLIEIIGAEDKVHKLLLLLSSFVLIFNQCTLEYLLFPESAVMCFALLCVILAAIQTIQEEKYKYLKVFLLMFIATISYQPLILSFPFLVLFFYCINIKNFKDKKKIIIFKELLIYAIFFIVVIGIELLIVKYFCNLLDYHGSRLNIPTYFGLFAIKFCYEFDSAIIVLINFMDLLPTMFLPIILLLSLTLMLFKKNSSNYVIPMICLIFFNLFVSAILLSIFVTGVSARTNWNFGIIWGISLIFLLLRFNINTKIDKIVFSFIVISFILNSFMLLRNSSLHTATNIADINKGYTIKMKIDDYERKTGNVIKKFQYVYGKDSSFYYVKGMKKTGSLTESALQCAWSINQALNYYTGKKLKHTEEPMPKEFVDMYYRKDSNNNYYDNQIYFDKDTMYIIIY